MIRWILVLVAALFVGFLFYVELNNDPPENLGVNEGLLLPCPTTPNCVSSQADPDDEVHYVEPLIFRGSAADMQLALEKWLLDSGSARIVTSELGYLYVEVKSDIIGYIDDVEFYWPESETVMHMRSASRVGYSDMDVNRSRVNQVRDWLASTSSQPQ